MFKSILVALALVASAGLASAHDYKIGDLDIAHPWTRATPKGATIAGGYFKITNKGTQADRLVSGTSEFAGRFEIHQMSMENGVMRMRPLPDGIEIKPGETVEFKPGSYHVMFMDLKQGLEQGKRVKGTLTFEKAGKVDVEYVVDAVAAKAQDHSGHAGH